MVLKDWNHAHQIKEQIEEEYDVFVHILGKGCLITTSNPKLIENNNWNDCIAMIEPTPDEIELISGLDWCGKVFDLFFDNIKILTKMKTNLTKSITIHSAYGVEVEYENGTVCRVDVNQPLYNYTEKTISVHVAIQDIENKEAKLLLHSLDKLTKEIDGKREIDNLENKYPDFYFAVTSGKLLFKRKNTSIYIGVNEVLEINNYLLKKGYNVLGLSSEYFKEKSISKNNSSRDIGLVDMMDIDTY